MSGRFQAPRGVPDVVPPASGPWLAVRDALSAPAQLSGYGLIELPVFEDTGLFVHGVGESTDVVSKEMYTFQDRGERSITLRPEGTAGVLRAVLEHGLDRGGLPVKLWYAGPMFRAERPQKGRLRQFQQVGVEAIGSEDPALDAEVVWLAWEAFRSLGITGVRLLLNSLGDSESRDIYRARLVEFLEGLELDEETRARARINPLRVLDDKRPEVVKQLVGVPELPDSLNAATRSHHDAVCQHLTDLGVPFEAAPRLVRGLDYYTRTTFELVHDGLGAQSAIGGGGRYDGLSESIGGPPLPGVGWALGLERTLLALEAEATPWVAEAAKPSLSVFFVPIGEPARSVAIRQLGSLRHRGISADMAYDGRGMKGAMKAADRSGATFAVIIGEREVEAGTFQVKRLETGDQVELTNLDESLNDLLAGAHGPLDVLSQQEYVRKFGPR
jgi:histidyl-tRNA synthetase